MTELQQNRYDKLLRRVGGMIGPGSMVNDALTELFPMIDVESLNAELAFLADWRLAFGSLTHLASAGEFNHVQLFNPENSGMLVVLERVDFEVNTNQFVEYVMSDVALTDFTANEAMRDTRPGIVNVPVAQIRDDQTGSGIANTGQIFVRANTNETLLEKKGLFVLAPNTGVRFSTTIANVGSTFTFNWRERTAEPSELNFP